MKTEKPILDEVFADNGEHSHWVLIDPTNGEKLWSEDPTECKAMGFPVSPSHSEDTETTEKEWTYVIGSEGCTVRHHDKPKFYELTINEAIEICDKFNSYSTLKAENERLTKRADDSEQAIVDLLLCPEWKTAKELLDTKKNLDGVSNLYHEALSETERLQSDNEAKEKRVKELTVLLNKSKNLMWGNSDNMKTFADMKPEDIMLEIEAALTQ